MRIYVDSSDSFPGLGGYPSLDYSEQDIIFPDLFALLFDDPPSEVNSPRGPPKCANGKTFCENVESYPYRHLKETLKKNPIYKDFFGKDEAPVEIANRVGGDQSRYFCASIVSTIYPQIGKNKNNKWKFIINQKEEDGLVQGVLVETCRKPDKPCDILVDLPAGYTTSCKQKYIYRRLLALDGSGSVYPDSFQIPTACCCSYTRNTEFLARFGAAVTPVRKKDI
nr:protein spaetzle-like [Leptinotarsa decemlineata]